jgi:hypothetical protein
MIFRSNEFLAISVSSSPQNAWRMRDAEGFADAAARFPVLCVFPATRA